MMDEKDHVSKQAMENSFFDEIKALKTPEVLDKYIDLNKRILEDKLTEVEKFVFIEATAETDIFLSKKLGDDFKLFVSRKDRILKFLQDYLAL